MAKTVFFTAQYPCEIIWASEVHTTAGSDGSAVTLQLEKLTGTQAPGAGTTLLAAAFNLKGTANTVVTKKGTDLTTTRTNLLLDSGDRIALLYSGTLTDVAGVQVSISIKQRNKGHYRKP